MWRPASDQDVDAAVTMGHSGDRFAHFGLAAHVEDRVLRADGARGGLGGVGVEVRDNCRGAGGREQLRRGAADAARAAGDNGDLSRERQTVGNGHGGDGSLVPDGRAL
jgi:hypothetical protein